MAAKGNVSVAGFLDARRTQFRQWRDLPVCSGYSADVGLRVLFDNRLTKKNPVLGVFVVMTLAPLLMFGVIAAASGTLTLEQDQIGFLDDFVVLALLPVLGAMLCLTRRLLGKANAAFTGVQSALDKDKVEEDDYSDLLKRIWKIVEGRGKYARYRIAFMAGGFFYWVWSSLSHYFYIGYDGTEIWSFGDHPVAYAARVAWEFAVFVFIFPAVIYKVIALIYAMNRFFNEIEVESFRLRPVSPDGAAGLGDMGELALNMEYLFLPLVGVAIINYLQNGLTTTLLILFPGLVCLLVVVFWFPLWSAHSTMLQAKSQALELLETEFNHHYDFLIFTIESEDATLGHPEPSQAVETVEKLKYLYEETEKMPVWPFDTAVLKRFSATIVIPVLVVLIPEFIVRL